MKVAIISAVFIGFAAAQTTMNYMGQNRFCAVANETAVCGDLGADYCCGTISTKVGTAAATTTNKCIPRDLSENLNSVSYLTGTTTPQVTTTVTYTCLTTTRPATFTPMVKCTNETNCTTSGYCCASFNYTAGLNSTTQQSSLRECVPGSMGLNQGSI